MRPWDPKIGNLVSVTPEARALGFSSYPRSRVIRATRLEVNGGSESQGEVRMTIGKFHQNTLLAGAGYTAVTARLRGVHASPW